MGMNPFGEESDSLHAWKERYKQQQFQAQTLSAQLGETKSHLRDLQVKFEEITSQLKSREEELLEVKQELKIMKQVAKDKEAKISDLELKVQTNRLDRLIEENNELREKVEDLQGQILRGASPGSTSTTAEPSQVTSALIPMMLHQFDPSNPNYENAFINLVETVIDNGDTLAKVIGILVKYGGEGPIENVKNLVNSPEFDIALELLQEEQIITVIDDMLYLSANSAPLASNSWEDMKTDELFALLLEIAEKKPKNDLIEAMQQFRDILQNRQVPLTTIFFEIRKTIERIEKDRIDRKDVVDQIKTWYAKYEALQ